MASSKVVTTNPDLPRDSSSISSNNSLSTLLLHLSDSDLHHPNTMDDLLNSIYPNTTPPSSTVSTTTTATAISTKTVDDVWKEIVAGTASGAHRGAGAVESLEGMTLEDFLTKAGAVRDEDVRGGGVPPPLTPTPTRSITTSTTAAAATTTTVPQFAMPVEEAFGNGVEGTVVGSSGSGGKGKRRAVEEPVDKATLQKQRRMIKNRESAARSRERKQAYTSDLEYQVKQLEEENSRLLREEADRQRQRYQQLMECLIPIEERLEPKRRRLRRTNSV